MKVASLFSGIGGLDFGLEQSGHEVVLQVERDPHCVQVLQRQFPVRELVTDIAGIHVLPPDVELLAAGFPCQVCHLCPKTYTPTCCLLNPPSNIAH